MDFQETLQFNALVNTPMGEAIFQCELDVSQEEGMPYEKELMVSNCTKPDFLSNKYMDLMEDNLGDLIHDIVMKNGLDSLRYSEIDFESDVEGDVKLLEVPTMFAAGCEFDLEKFKKACDENDRVTYLVLMPDIQEIVDVDLEGLNEICCDDTIPNGHLLEDINYETVWYQDHAYIQVNAHAGSFLAENEIDDE